MPKRKRLADCKLTCVDYTCGAFSKCADKKLRICDLGGPRSIGANFEVKFAGRRFVIEQVVQ